MPTGSALIPGPRGWVRGAAVLVSALALAVLSGSGCASNADSEGASARSGAPITSADREQARGSLSAIKISGHSRTTVRDTVDSVFTGAGLRRGKSTGDQLVFERPASRGQRAAYGNWMGDEVVVRLKVDVTLQGRDLYLITCRCFVVREGGSMAEDEQPLARRRMREFQPLLEEVGKRLN